MPTSNYETIPHIIRIALELKPKSVLDVGAGFGKYGFLLREYLGLWLSSDDTPYAQLKREVRIDGIEVFPPVVSEFHRLIYDTIHVGDANVVVDGLGDYDMILFCDAIEHFTKQDGHTLLGKLAKRANKAIVITTPVSPKPQTTAFGNPAEHHISKWLPTDFQPYGFVSHTIRDGALVVVISTDSSRMYLGHGLSWMGRARQRAANAIARRGRRAEMCRS